MSGTIYALLGMLLVSVIITYRAMESNNKFMWACGLSLIFVFSIFGLLMGEKAQKIVHGFGFLFGICYGLATCRNINEDSC